MPIPYMVITRYAENLGIVGNDFRLFHRLMTAIDDEWLSFRAKQKEAAK
ncbi:MAG: hypothetical protein LCH86_20815 [Proteobacteria bacterium]|nr:hypothetical protein [Pseudomonadota bacterium]